MISEELMNKIRARRARAQLEKMKQQGSVHKVKNSHVMLTTKQINAIRAVDGLPPIPDPDGAQAGDDGEPNKPFHELMAEYRQKNNVGAIVAFKECVKHYPEAYRRAKEGR